jgi:putative membrane protein insertion efficiency factor
MVTTKQQACLLFMVIIASTAAGFAQIKSDLKFIISNNPTHSQTTPVPDSASRKEVSELKLLFTGLIRGYKVFISSQQSQTVCTFTPSCSQFGVTAIERFGVFQGLLLTSDRFQRCHGFSANHYPIYPTTGKFYDPIDHYSPTTDGQ